MADLDALAAKYGGATAPPDYDAIAAKYQAPAAAAPSVAPDNSLLGQIGQAYQDMKTRSQQVPYVGNLLHGFLQTPHAITQAVANLGNQAGLVSDKDLADYKALSNASENAYQGNRQANTTQTLADTMQGKMTAPGIDWLSLAGNAVSTAPILAAKLPGYVGAVGTTPASAVIAGQKLTGPALLGAKTLLGMGVGGTLAAVTPTSDAPGTNYDADKLAQLGIGIGTGGLAPVIGTGIGKVVGGVVNAVSPLVAPARTAGNALLNRLSQAPPAANAAGAPAAASAGNVGALVGQDPAAVLARLKAAQQLVPGSAPTTAQVAGVPELVMAENVLRNNPNTLPPFVYRAMANNQARLQALGDVAQTPEALQAAQAARQSASQPLYQAAKAEQIPIDADLQAILNRPSAKAAIARGMKLAEENGEDVANMAPQTSAPATSMLLDASGNPIPMKAAQTAPGAISGNMLQYLKMGLDDLQSTGKTTGMGSHEAKALGNTQQALQDWMGNNSPNFSAANAAYRQGSMPVNTMELGQQLQQALQAGTQNAAGDVSPALSQFRSQYAKALKDSPYGIDPAAKSLLDNIQSDLQRETISNSVRGGAGSNTVFNLQAPNWLASTLYGPEMAGKSLMGRALGAGAGLLGGGGPMAMAGGVMGVDKLGQIAGQKVSGELQKAMLDPQYFAQLLEAAMQRQAPNVSNKFPGLLQTGAAGVQKATTPSQ